MLQNYKQQYELLSHKEIKTELSTLFIIKDVSENYAQVCLERIAIAGFFCYSGTQMIIMDLFNFIFNYKRV